MALQKAPSKNPDKPTRKKSTELKNIIRGLVLALTMYSCTENYPNNEFNFSYDWNNKIEGCYNIHFNHSEGSAGYNVDNYNINLSQIGKTYILRINEDEYNVGSPEEAEDLVCDLISTKNKSFVHDKYIKKAESKTADFMKKYSEYKDNPERPRKLSIKLKNGKPQK